MLHRRLTWMVAATVVAAILLVGTLLAAGIAGIADGRSHKPLATNVILLIDDGAGYNHHEAGSLYDTGLRAGEAYNDFPFRFGVSTYSFGDVPKGGCPATPVGYDPDQAWADFGYVVHDPTDSAAAATAMATGIKTYDSAIGVDCNGGKVENVVEVFEKLGKSTGVVTSVPVSHATPAAFVAHNPARDEYTQIAKEMFRTSATDVVMGAGHPSFDPLGAPVATPNYKWIDKNTWAGLKAGTMGADADNDGTADPYTLVETRAAFQALMTGDTPKRVAGFAQVRRTLQLDRAGDATAQPFAVPFVETVPTLPEMTAGALNVLDNDPDGLFLMVEGGATDLAAHDNSGGRMIEEEISFDRAVDTVLSWVDQHSNWGETLVIVTSDHETGYLTGPGSGATPDGPVWVPLADNGQGVARHAVQSRRPHQQHRAAVREGGRRPTAPRDHRRQRPQPRPLRRQHGHPPAHP